MGAATAIVRVGAARKYDSTLERRSGWSYSVSGVVYGLLQ